MFLFQKKKMSVNNCVFRVAGLLRNFELKVRIRKFFFQFNSKVSTSGKNLIMVVMHGGTDLLCEYVSRQARLCGGVGRERP